MYNNPISNRFEFRLPDDFLYQSIIDKYNDFFKIIPNNYYNISEYINHGITSITFPGFSGGLNNVQQRSNSRSIEFQDGQRPTEAINKKFTVTFRAFENYLNYWILFEQLFLYREFPMKLNQNPKTLVDKKRKNDSYISREFLIHYNDDDGNYVMTQKLMDIKFDSISDISMSYNDISNNVKTFTCGFSFNYLEFGLNYDFLKIKNGD